MSPVTKTLFSLSTETLRKINVTRTQLQWEETTQRNGIGASRMFLRLLGKFPLWHEIPPVLPLSVFFVFNRLQRLSCSENPRILTKLGLQLLSANVKKTFVCGSRRQPCSVSEKFLLLTHKVPASSGRSDSDEITKADFSRRERGKKMGPYFHECSGHGIYSAHKALW